MCLVDLPINVEVEQAYAFRVQCFDARRRCITQDSAVVAAKLTRAEVAHEDQNHVGFRRLGGNGTCVNADQECGENGDP